MTEINEEEEENITNLKDKCKVRWALPTSVRNITFIGKNVIGICHDVYIIFIDLKTGSEIIYYANSKLKGDGVDCISGHRLSMFAFAEKCNGPRIFILSYPTLLQINTLSDPDIHRYKAVCMAENDFVVAFSGYPNYVLTVWSWRTSQKLVTLQRDSMRRNQLYIPSNTHCLLAEVWTSGFHVWEIAPCFKQCMVMKRQYKGDFPDIRAACWSQEGYLYYIDSYANLYGALSDGTGMFGSLEWSSNTSGEHQVGICTYYQGLLIYCPDGVFKYLKKVEKEWEEIWAYTCQYSIIQLISNAAGLLAVAWSKQGHVFTIKNDAEESVVFQLFVYKHRRISKVQIINPEGKYFTTLNEDGEICLYDVAKSHLVDIKHLRGDNIIFASNPVRPLLAVCGEIGSNYGVSLLRIDTTLECVSSFCLTHQIVCRLAFSPTGNELVAAALSAGHMLLLKVDENDQLIMLRYVDIGRALSDCLLMVVGVHMRLLGLVLYSDKYKIGEKIVCMNAVTLQDNKFAGKMYGPYMKLIACATPNIMIAIPHDSKQLHMMQLFGDKGQTVQVKVIKMFESGHDLKSFKGSFSPGGFLTYGLDGHLILRRPDVPEEYDLKFVAGHRYKTGLRYGLVDMHRRYILCQAFSREVTIHYLDDTLPEVQEDIVIKSPKDLLEAEIETIPVFDENQMNWLDLEEDRLVETERLEYAVQKGEVVAMFKSLQRKLVTLLEQNLAAPPLHQLPIVEFNLHLEAKQNRIKQAAEEREMIRLQLLARIVAQNNVTEWIKEHCWSPMKTPRAKIFAIFSHYVVESYTVLGIQRDMWPELDKIKCLLEVEVIKDSDIHTPWIEEKPEMITENSLNDVDSSSMIANEVAIESSTKLNPYVLSGTLAHNYITVPNYAVPQLLTYSFLHMNWLSHITKYNTQNMRTWFNKQFDDLMNVKVREVGLVEERNRRFRIIISELNTLAELRGSEERIYIDIQDPIWNQEEIPLRLIKVEPEEVSVTPYISPSQIVIVPPDPGPKDDFRERALMDMMDGVLEKLWHEEIKKPIPKPACMIEKAPENWNEDDLRAVYDYEAKVEFRNEEREKYRKMLHAEYAKLTAIFNEGIVRFNSKVKEMFVCKLKVETVIGQENLNLMRLRRVNLDRIEASEETESLRDTIAACEREIEVLQRELKLIHEQSVECQTAYEALASKDKMQDRNFKSNFADLSPIVTDQCYKMFKKRPKWNQRATMIPTVLNEMAQVCLTGVKTVFLHPDCMDYLRMLDQLDNISNMPAVMDEGLWITMCKLRRAKIDTEIRMRGIVLESAYVDNAVAVWNKALSAKKLLLAATNRKLVQHKEEIEVIARNRSVQLAMKAGLIEIPLTGHIEDFSDATLIKMDEVEAINATILKIGRFKLALMKKHTNFRRGILAKEWEHAQLKMKIRHMEEELYSFERLKISKELQAYLKGKAKGWTDDQDYAKMEKEFDAEKVAFNKLLCNQIQQTEDMEVKVSQLSARMSVLEEQIFKLKIALSEKRLRSDPLEPIRRSKIANDRMATLVQRSQLVHELQSNQTTIIMLQTELELLRLKTYPTLSTFKPVCV